MSLATDVQTLVSRGAYYFREHHSRAVAFDFIDDLFFGTGRTPINPNHDLLAALQGPVYTDFHVHLHLTTNIRRALQEASKRVEVLAITGRTADSMFNTHHTFDTVLAQCEKEGVSYDKLGDNSAMVFPHKHTEAFLPLYLVRATEVYPKEMLGVVAVGRKLHGRYYHGKPDLAEVVADASGNSAFWFFDHPFSMAAPLISFLYPT